MLINLGSTGFMRVLSVVCSALVYFIIALIIMKALSAALKKILKKFNVDEIVSKFVISMVKVVLWVVTILVTLSAIGFDISSLITVLATCGVAIALALKDSLGNIAGGILVITSKNFGKGDFIEVAGKAGTVQEVGLLYTTVLTPDNQTVTIPNGVLTTNSVSNYSREGTRRVDMDFGIAYKSDIAKAKEVIAAMALKDERVFREPAPFVAVDKYEDNAVVFAFRVYCSAADYWGVKFDLQDKVKDTLAENGIAVPSRHLDVTVEK
ncbi:MAG: mechanosensitive ion channel family protein [Firmicutes bacterium]|nr:mechanosensitive ion channel family protein [Bacillota bacterium]